MRTSRLLVLLILRIKPPASPEASSTMVPGSGTGDDCEVPPLLGNSDIDIVQRND